MVMTTLFVLISIQGEFRTSSACARLAQQAGLSRQLTPEELKAALEILRTAEARAEAAGIALSAGILRDIRRCRSDLNK